MAPQRTKSHLWFLVLITFCLRRSHQTPSPEIHHSGHYYRDKYFAEQNEGQSCNDISAVRTKGKFVSFCAVPAPELGVSTTLSFWGWDQGHDEIKGLVQVFAVSNTSEEIKQFEIQVPRSRKGKYNVSWFHREFKLISESSQNFTELKLYYHVGKGRIHQLDLRDVWIRPTSVDNGKRPSRWCNRVYFPLSLATTIVIALIFSLFVEAEGKHRQICTVFTFFLIPPGIMFTHYLDKYPHSRCKDETLFEATIVLFIIAIVITLLYSFVWDHYLNQNNRIRTTQIVPILENGGNRLSLEINNPNNNSGTMNVRGRTRSIVPLNNDQNFISNLDVIQIATRNSLRMKGNDNTVYPIYHNDESECSICMNGYNSDRRAVVTKCGHVWCSECIVDICKMGPPSHKGLCPTCRSEVLLKELLLFEVVSGQTIAL